MRVFGFCLAILGAGFPALAADLPAPITPAGRGQLQCYAPDAAHKTCQSLAAYRPGAAGGIDNIAVVLVSTSPAIAMATISPVTIKAGEVCGFIRPEDIATAVFTEGGHPLDPAQAATVGKQVQGAMKAFYGHEICTAYVPDGESFVARESIDGAPQPSMNQRVIWVSPSDGYSVGR